MLDIKEIEWAISCLEREESSFPNLAKLADLYAVRDRLTGNSMEPRDADPRDAGYSRAAMPATIQSESLDTYGESEFLRSISGKDSAAAWRVMDELMDTLHVVNVKVYNSVMGKIREL